MLNYTKNREEILIHRFFKIRVYEHKTKVREKILVGRFFEKLAKNRIFTNANIENFGKLIGSHRSHDFF